MRKFAAIGASLLLAGGMSLVALPAHAAPYITICNSNYSVAWIKAYNNTVFKEYYIGYGVCKSVDNYGGDARVNVDPEYSGSDVDSWTKWEAGQPGDGCHEGENGSSNPYNGTTTWYKNYPRAYC